LGEEHLRRALDLNRPTNLMLTFVDYLNHEDKNKASWDSLTQKTRDWITTLESKMGVFFNYLSTGPAPEHTIVRKSPGEMLVYVQNCPPDAC
jgi:adenylosuccinate synthase